MATIAAAPFVLKDCLVTIGTDDFQKAVTKVQFTPSASIQVAKAVSPGAVYTDAEEASWTLDLEWLQDWATSGNLGKYLHDNEGDTVSMTFEPITGGATVTASVVLTPGPIGGGVGVFAPATASLGVVGKPAIGA
jgi:hypothetical protein